MTRTLVALVLFCAALSAVQAIKCFGISSAKANPTDDFVFREEDWWVLLKAPQATSGENQNMLYVSPTFPQGLIVPHSHGGVEALFNKQHDAAVDENRSAYEEWWKNVMPQFAEEERNADNINVVRPSHYPDHKKPPPGLDLLAFTSKLKVWQIWFNDQQPFDTLSGRDKTELKYAHSKYMASFALDGESAVVLQHSFPVTPIQLYAERHLYKANGAIDLTPDNWLKTRIIFPKLEKKDSDEKKQANKKNVFLRAQHAMCLSVGTKEDVAAVIDLLIFSHPQFVNTNILAELIDQTKPNYEKIKKLIKGNTIVDKQEKCENEWKKYTAAAESSFSDALPPQGLIWGRTMDILKKFINPLSPFVKAATPGAAVQSVSDCAQAFVISSNDNNNADKFVIVSHVPMTHSLRSSGTELMEISSKTGKTPESVILLKNSPQSDIDSFQSIANLGPFAWLTTSMVINAPLFVSFWRNDPLPSIYSEDFGVITVSQIDAGTGLTWTHGQGHEKMGVSADSEKPWVCFGDSNHRGSEISHAGMMICIKNNNLWQKMNSIIKSD